MYTTNIIYDKTPQTETRERLSNWLIDLHNKVNEKNNKPAWQYEKVYDHYHNNPNSSFKVVVVGIIIVTIIGLVLLYA